MFVILNAEKLFYSKNEKGENFFTNDFVKATTFDTYKDAEDEWETEGIPAYFVTIENI